jgi:predicted DNA-binding transcriptional regulator YafY
MSYHDYYKKLSALIELIEKQNTGDANVLAEKLQVSRRTLFRYLEELRDYGADITFSKPQNSYILNNDFCFFEHFIKRVL